MTLSPFCLQRAKIETKAYQANTLSINVFDIRQNIRVYNRGSQYSVVAAAWVSMGIVLRPHLAIACQQLVLVHMRLSDPERLTGMQSANNRCSKY
jgi:hypothetical protein